MPGVPLVPGGAVAAGLAGGRRLPEPTFAEVSERLSRTPGAAGGVGGALSTFSASHVGRLAHHHAAVPAELACVAVAPAVPVTARHARGAGALRRFARSPVATVAGRDVAALELHQTHRFGDQGDGRQARSKGIRR
jgi:hypothetical protein